MNLQKQPLKYILKSLDGCLISYTLPHRQELTFAKVEGQLHHKRFFIKKNVYKKMSLNNPKILRKCKKNFPTQMLELQFFKTLIFLRVF